MLDSADADCRDDSLRPNARTDLKAYLLYRHEAFQLLSPVLDDDEFGAVVLDLLVPLRVIRCLRNGTPLYPDEALPVGGHIVGSAAVYVVPRVVVTGSANQLQGSCGCETRGVLRDIHTHYRARGVHVKEFLSAPSPQRLPPAVRRYLPSPRINGWKWPHVDLVLP